MRKVGIGGGVGSSRSGIAGCTCTRALRASRSMTGV
jgi:hypothetical protein